MCGNNSSLLNVVIRVLTFCPMTSKVCYSARLQGQPLQPALYDRSRTSQQGLWLYLRDRRCDVFG